MISSFKEKISNISRRELVRALLIMAVCIAVNYIGKWIAVRLGLPLWMDSVGTIFTAYVLGPVFGAIVGVAGNISSVFIDPTSLVYAVTSVFIGIIVGRMARKGYFDSVFHATSVAAAVTIIAVFISTILNFIFYGGYIGNEWGDGVREFFMSKGLPFVLSSFIGQLYVDFLDKIISVMAVFYIIKLHRYIKGRKVRSAHTMLTLLLCALLLSASMPQQARAIEVDPDQTYVQTIYSSDNGLPCGHANDIAETPDGIKWIGTYAGLYRYNGSEFRLMREYDAVKNVICLYVDSEGRLWIGTNDNGVSVAEEEKIISTLDGKGGLASNSVRSIVQSSAGDYYIGTTDGMIVASFDKNISVQVELQVNNASSSAADSNGHVAAVTAEGKLYLLQSRSVTGTIDLPGGEGTFKSVSFDDSGLLYAGTSDGRIFKYDISGEDPVQVSVLDCTGMTTINEIAVLSSGTVCVCADNGIGYVHPDGSFSKTETGIFTDSIENMLIDYQGNVWFASSRHGLLRLAVSAFADIYSEAGLSMKVVNTTAIRGGLLYSGTDTGLDIIDTASREPVSNALTNMLEGVRIRCIKPDSSGNLWICTNGKGLLEIDPAGGIKNYSSEQGNIGTRVRVSEELSDGTIAVGGDNGLSFIKNGAVEGTIPYGEELGFAKILCLIEGNDGILYAGTDGNGIVAVKDGEVIKTLTRDNGLTSEVILRIVRDTKTDGAFVVTSNGLCYMTSDSVRPLTNFPYYNNYDIYINDRDQMFIMSSAGIYTMSREDLMTKENPGYEILNSNQGLLGALTANSWNGTDADKNLYLAADRGVFMVNTDRYAMQTGVSRIRIAEIYADEVEQGIGSKIELTIGKDVRNIEIIPEIIDFTLQDPVVSYYLEGIDSEPRLVPQSDLPSIVYTNIPYGEYVFHLAVIEKGSGSILEENTYKIIKEKQIYDHGWFIFYLIAVAAMFVGWLTWFVTRTQIQRVFDRHERELQAALKEVRMENETIIAIAKTVDAKDVRTSKHSQRVSEYSVMIAREIGFSEEEQENLRRAALLHDIGKIGIPDSILNKPARLTDEEYAEMKTHVTKGAEILKDVTMIDHVVEGSRYHHERYDGKGYPDGLKGKEIPLYGRIIAVADAFDAMTANRVYRKQLDWDFVLNEMKRCSGTQFDPELLEVFLKLIEDGKIDIEALYAENKREGEE